MIVELTAGETRVRHGATWDRYALSGGVLHVRDHQAVIMADAAEPVAGIDVERARQALGRARDRLGPGRLAGGIDTGRAQLALARAINRLRVAGPGIDS
jgi:F-type H+-transporting ATPase subunit epsilon